MNADELIERFSLFDDWEERYAYLIDLGRKLPGLDDVHKTELNRVPGCVSQVWLVHEFDGSTLTFEADSDAFIVRGLVAILVHLYSGLTPEQVEALDIESVFGQLGLSEHLTPNRRSGFFSMVGRIQGAGAAAGRRV
ncbi:MAG: SufE family protein [Myxococcota bacterium]